MTQLTINIEDKSILPHLKKILNALEGVTIAKPTKKNKKSGIEQALEDVKAGRVTQCKDVDDMFHQILGI
jgi:vacuolar-type H+-ATPase subunit D/Vma8